MPSKVFQKKLHFSDLIKSWLSQMPLLEKYKSPNNSDAHPSSKEDIEVNVTELFPQALDYNY